MSSNFQHTVGKDFQLAWSGPAVEGASAPKLAGGPAGHLQGKLTENERDLREEGGRSDSCSSADRHMGIISGSLHVQGLSQ